MNAVGDAGAGAGEGADPGMDGYGETGAGVEGNGENGAVRLLLDTDAGIDGAFAILYAMRAPSVRLEGVTTVGGAAAAGAGAAANTALRLIAAANPARRVPVAAGAASPLARDADEPQPGLHGRSGLGDALHGRNGLGDVLLAPPPAGWEPLRESAASWLVRRANAEPGRLTLALTGRATNWAQALAIDPSIAGKFARVIVAGGTVLAPGDATPIAERSFRADPEAAARLFATAERLTAVGLDATARLALTAERLARLERYAAPERARLAQLLRRLHDYRARHPLDAGQPAGAVPLKGVAAVLAAAEPELFAFRTWRASVVAGDGPAAGFVVADRRSPSTEGRPVRFAMEVDAERALERFVAAFLA